MLRAGPINHDIHIRAFLHEWRCSKTCTLEGMGRLSFLRFCDFSIVPIVLDASWFYFSRLKYEVYNVVAGSPKGDYCSCVFHPLT